jgi:predicted oxidoreductase
VADLRSGDHQQVRTRLRKARAHAARPPGAQRLSDKASSLAELAQKAGIDATELEKTVREYNVGAERGEDSQFGRGKTSFNRYLADPANKPNPCVAPIGKGPYYAVKVIMGDLGTFDGLRTNVVGQVLKDNGEIVPGLYAVGNDRASIMGGNYPGAGITLGPNMTFGYITGRYVAGVERRFDQALERQAVAAPAPVPTEVSHGA